jgi:hypothetical protein
LSQWPLRALRKTVGISFHGGRQGGGTIPDRDYLQERDEVRSTGINMRTIVATTILVSMIAPALAQTQPTHPSAYPTFRTLQLAWATAPLNPCYWRGHRHGRSLSFNPSSPCYTGTPYLDYSAIEPFQFPETNRHTLPGSASLNEDQAKLSIEAKGYLNISRLEKDARGIWRGKATMKDGRSVDVTLDLEGNIYSEPSTLYIRIEPAPSNR